MPKDTFFNLPKEKQEKIIDAASLEFEQAPFDQASINRIVSSSGISKGSFYQYFEDKKDLYKYLLSLIVEKKMTYITPVMLNPFDHPFFEVVRDMNKSGLAFAKDHPQYMRIGNWFIKDKTHPVYLEIISENEKVATNVYELLLRKAIEKGEIRPDIDVPFTAHMIFSLSTQMVDYNSDTTQEDWLDHMFQSLDKLLDLLSKGMLKNP